LTGPSLLVIALLCAFGSLVASAAPRLLQEPPPPTQTAPLSAPKKEESTVGYRVPIQFNPPQQPYIMVEAYLLKEDSLIKRPDGKPLLFIVDTGMPPALVLTEWAAKKMGFKTVVSLKNGDQQLEPVRLLCLQPERDTGFVLSTKWAYQAKSLSILDHVSRQPIAGIIGMGMLAPSTHHFNLDRKTWTFFSNVSVSRSMFSEKALILPYSRFQKY
jgi:hypothetical protein